jgi:NadR type nicotinamide-nucleotide adenylyltransferase
MRVVVTGSECTGKTTLAEALAEHCQTICIPEYARQFVRGKLAAPEYANVEAIARGQIALEDEAALGGRDLLIQDTDLLSTVVYSRHYYGDCPHWIEDELDRRRPDLYLLAGIDVPWKADGDQRDRGHRREEMQALFRGALEQCGARVVEVRGPHANRLKLALEAIERL